MQVKLIPYSGNPLKEGSLIARCNFRSIAFINDMYHIFEEDHIYGAWRIFKRLSKNGIDMGPRIGPLLPLGRSGEFDEMGNADPTVIYDGQWKMWFDGFDKTLYWDKLGYATSKDGENWIKYGPVLKRGESGDWDLKSIHHPVVLVHDKYYLYYSGCCDDIYNVKDIGLAVSVNGIEWDKFPDPVIYHGSENKWDCKYVRPSLPIYINDCWLMFYWGFDGVNHSMGLAMSKDLIKWEKIDKMLSGTNEHDGITGSQPINDGKLKIYYTTWDNVQIHLAEIKYE